MNKLILSLFLVLFGSKSSFSQDEEVKNITAGKKFGVDVYYGTPMFFQWIVGQAVMSISTDVYDDKIVRNGGPFGIRFDYLLSEDFTIGFDLGYNSISASASRTEEIYNSTTGTFTAVQYRDEFKSSKLGGLITFNVKVFQSENFETSGVLGLGYGQRKLSFNSNDPSYDQNTYGFGDNLVDAPVYPFSFRFGIINRYFFTPNVGINLGIGIGQGGLINGGLSMRF